MLKYVLHKLAATIVNGGFETVTKYIQAIPAGSLKKEILKKYVFRNCLITAFGSAFSAFGLYHVHAQSGVTEGGILGLTLLLEYWFAISPAVSGFLLNVVCYLLGIRFLGKKFLVYSAISATGFSVTYKICEQFKPLWPQLFEMPLLAAFLGAIFIGFGVGICVRIGGAPGGDDALAMSISHVTKLKIQWVYLIMDLIVLGLSITYIPWQRIWYSLLTVILSGQMVGWVADVPLPSRKRSVS